MADIHDEIDVALNEASKARKQVASRRTKQVTNADEIALLKATAFAWCRTHRPVVITGVDATQLAEVDTAYATVLQATTRAAARTTYLASLKSIREQLADLLPITAMIAASPPAFSPDRPPDFTKFGVDAKMQAILVRRWNECQRCIAADAPLAATVMMGGMLEALCLARANKMTDKSPLFKAIGTPKHPKTGAPLPLTEWTLRPYLDVGHEIGWFTRSAKDVGVVLRDYRNYIHPQKEYSHGVVLSITDAKMFWDVTKGLCLQLLTP